MQWEDLLNSRQQSFVFKKQQPDKSIIDKIVEEIHTKCPSKQNRVLYDLRILDWSNEELRLDLYKSTDRDSKRPGHYNPQCLAPYLFVWSQRENLEPSLNKFGEDNNPEYSNPAWRIAVTNMEIGICSMFTVFSAQAKGLASGFCKCINPNAIVEKYGLNPLLFLGVGYGYELPPLMFWCPVNKKNMSVPYGNENKPKVDSYVSYSV